MTFKFFGIFSLNFLLSSWALANEAQFIKGKEALEKMQGCYLVDFSYSETESLKEGYQLDPRVYDVNKDKAIKEWIYLDQISSTEFRLQHVMFGTTLDGQLMEGSELKHTGEDWVYNEGSLFDFTAPNTWERKSIAANTWTRKVTNLDDGLRYQCAASWNLETAYPEWTCSSYSPIPGREYRDMGRKDYNTLDRTSRVIVYGPSWLERQENVKTIHGADNSRTPLAKEVGKNWYVKLPDSECKAAQDFLAPRTAFWSVLRDSWKELLSSENSFIEKIFTDGSSRYFDILSLEYEYMEQDLSSPPVRDSAKDAVKAVIRKYKE